VIVGASLLPESEITPAYFKLRISDTSKGISKIAGLPANWAANTPSGKYWAAKRAQKESAGRE